jgi:hypothetical protein
MSNVIHFPRGQVAPSADILDAAAEAARKPARRRFALPMALRAALGMARREAPKGARCAYAYAAGKRGDEYVASTHLPPRGEASRWFRVRCDGRIDAVARDGVSGKYHTKRVGKIHDGMISLDGERS